MDNKEHAAEDAKDSAKQGPSQGTLRREVDSLDDFEHLGHDSSPLKETATSGTGDLPETSPTRDEFGVINKGVETAATAANVITDELSSFDPLQSSQFDSTTKKMDSNLLQMGDHFGDKKESDQKMDKFLEDLTIIPPKHEEPPEIKDKDKPVEDNYKTATQNFMDIEREPIQPAKKEASNELLDKYSDSEPDNDDDFKPSKYEDFPKKAELPESFGSTDNFKQETFKDLEPEPEPPKKDYPSAPPEPEKVVPVKVEEKPEPAKQKLPEEVKQERAQEKPAVQPEVVCKKPAAGADEKAKKAAVIDAEAIFCKMGLVCKPRGTSPYLDDGGHSWF